MYCGFIKIRLPVIPIFQWEFVVELIYITKCSLECKVYHIALKGSIYPENYDLCIIFKKILTVLMYSMHHGPIYSEGWLWTCLYCRYKEGTGRITNNTYTIATTNESTKVTDVISIVTLKATNADHEKRIECRAKNEALREPLSTYVTLNVQCKMFYHLWIQNFIYSTIKKKVFSLQNPEALTWLLTYNVGSFNTLMYIY